MVKTTTQNDYSDFSLFPGKKKQSNNGQNIAENENHIDFCSINHPEDEIDGINGSELSQTMDQTASENTSGNSFSIICTNLQSNLGKYP